MCAASLLGTAALTVGPAQAGLVQDLMKQNMRGDLDPIEAIVQLMDARWAGRSNASPSLCYDFIV